MISVFSENGKVLRVRGRLVDRLEGSDQIMSPILTMESSGDNLTNERMRIDKFVDFWAKVQNLAASCYESLKHDDLDMLLTRALCREVFRGDVYPDVRKIVHEIHAFCREQEFYGRLLLELTAQDTHSWIKQDLTSPSWRTTLWSLTHMPSDTWPILKRHLFPPIEGLPICTYECSSEVTS